MIGGERPQALAQMVRVARPGARTGIAEPMCLPGPVPPEVLELDRRHKQARWSEYYFRTLDGSCGSSGAPIAAASSTSSTRRGSAT
jgi:hypothetical protein